MKKLYFLLAICLPGLLLSQQTIKSKNLKLKYTLPGGWNAEEFSGKKSWDDGGNDLCNCSSVAFTKMHNDGKLNVVIYPSTQGGLDSSKRNLVGSKRFDNVDKYDKTRNKNFSFEKKRSSFTDIKTNSKSFEVIRYFTKVDDHYYIIYAWQENKKPISPDTEKELYEMVNAVEPN
jgi:hypothetical protein